MAKMEPLTLALAESGPDLAPLIGGKAANLGVLMRGGFLVPPGICVTSAAYDRVVGDQLATVLTELSGVSPGDGPRLEELARRARSVVLAAPVPDDVADAVRGSASGPVAVRSSATAEDLPYASFAGQQDTYLDVCGPDAVLDAVRRCWASLWTDRAVAYRTTNGIDHRAVRLAVVVQDMVEAERAGVMFTANPVTGRRREAVIDASPGLGEAVVSGAVNPDHFVVDVDRGRVVHRRLAGEEACLTEQQVVGLAALGERVESMYRAPQDIEWAVDGAGRFWLTQARPITTLFPVPPEREGFRAYFNFNVAQGVYRPLTPMGLSTISALSTGVAGLWGIRVPDPLSGAPAMTAAAGRIFLDVTAPLRNDVGRAVLPRLLDVMEARSARVLRALGDDPRFAVLPFSRVRALGAVSTLMFRHRVPIRFLGAVVDPARAHRRAAAVGKGLRTRLETPAGASSAERLDHLVPALSHEFARIAVELLPRAAGGFATLGLAAWLLGDHVKPGELSAVLRSLPDNVTTEMDLELWRIADDIRQVPDAATLIADTPAEELSARFHAGTLPGIVDRRLRRFLTSYGDRAVGEIDVGLPRWSEDPSYLFGILAGYLQLTDPSSAPEAVFVQGAREAEELIEDLARRIGGWRGRAVHFALRRSRALMGMRELPKFYLVGLLARVRSELWSIGRELEQAGLLESAEDVFFLDLTELGPALNGARVSARVAARRDEYERELRRRHVPRVLLSDGTEPEMTAQAGEAPEGALRGTAASAGSVTGPAAVVLEPRQAHLRPGDILVCPSTDPGWTPLFLTAGGLVMEMGGANSHGAVVAREYGIPAVVGVPDAVARISSGDKITVDGTTGTVVLRP